MKSWSTIDILVMQTAALVNDEDAQPIKSYVHDGRVVIHHRLGYVQSISTKLRSALAWVVIK